MDENPNPKRDPVTTNLDGSKRHPAVAGVLQHMTYEHLLEKRPDLAEVSRPVCETAFHMADTLPENAELTVGLRKLLEAKDCMVRAYLDGR